MTESTKEDGVIQALAERLVKFRLPRTLEIKERVDAGELLNEMDMDYLEKVFSDASEIKPLVYKHPEWQDVAARM